MVVAILEVSQLEAVVMVFGTIGIFLLAVVAALVDQREDDAKKWK